MFQRCRPEPLWIQKNGLAEQNPAKVLAVTAVSSKKVPVVKGPRELPVLLKSSSLAFSLDKKNLRLQTRTSCPSVGYGVSNVFCDCVPLARRLDLEKSNPGLEHIVVRKMGIVKQLCSFLKLTPSAVVHYYVPAPRVGRIKR